MKSDNKCFRCYETNEQDRLHCKRTLPETAADRPNIKEERKDVDVRECIERGESVLMLGRPGTGKPTLINKLNEILEEKGQRAICAYKTHVAVSRLKKLHLAEPLCQLEGEAGGAIHNG